MARALPPDPARALGRPEDVAAAALFLLSDAARHVSGAVLDVTAGRIIA